MEKEEQPLEEEEGEENLSDTEIAERHAKCEVTERQKYLTILANQTHTHHRRGARRSRNNSQGGTPEPYSPDANLFEQSLPSSVNSSNAPSPLTTQDALSPSGATSLSSSSGTHRIRTSSWEKRRSSSASETNLENSLVGSFEELGYVENPWPPRNFPLDEFDITELGSVPEVSEEKEMDNSTAEDMAEVTKNAVNDIKMESGSSRNSPLEMLEESSGPEEIDDPNDPEWTVVSPDKQRSSIVLRLAKR